MPNEVHRGACLCGAVVFEVETPLRDVVACHCTQCRKTSGHYWAASSVPHERFRLIRADGLVWYRSSPTARRGHCGGCGAALFWQPEGEARISFSPGALETATGLQTEAHIFTEDGGDYYAESTAAPATPGARLKASCLCGDCVLDLPAPSGPITACHCVQCRKASGHFSASFDVPEQSVHWQRRDGLAEYRSAAGGTRGFCRSCGSGLWFRATDGAFSVEAGAVDGPTGGKLAAHIFVAERGDYYSLDDAVPQFAGAEP
ncbi:hypothetical protein IQ03_01789 [Gemmobacter caeni]|uniref:CENP-V/GFA domain-containing protein n=1 Tax=Gemmobacter caeni TaxID=589035 RepID=A0A2T6B4W5_9RHOB|nr:hypothetical protein C8N34_104192 [Gemmobacter caeni]TWJ01073.1 hypothetical protein IQ03_01789 [Gemmobacter caeni]